MANKRTLKKQINYLFFDVIDECFDVQYYNEAKTKETDALIDEIVEFRNEIMSLINKAESKKDYPAIIKKVEDAEDIFVEKLNKLQ